MTGEEHLDVLEPPKVQSQTAQEAVCINNVELRTFWSSSVLILQNTQFNAPNQVILGFWSCFISLSFLTRGAEQEFAS